MKYSSELCAIPDCPPTQITKDITAYRFVYDVVDENSFIPPGIKSPNRVTNEEDDKTKCEMLALSFFDTEANAKARYQYLRKRMKNIRHTLGGNLAEGQIHASQGFHGKIGVNGHFDFFERDGVTLSPQFQIIASL